jgi:signal transduction histidine kinase
MPAPELESKSRRGLHASALGELRVALRAIARGSEHARHHGAPRAVDGGSDALAEAGRLARELEDLIAYERAPRLRRVQCSAREIALAARLALPKAWRTRLLIVQDDLDASLCTDGALAARALSRLLHNAFEAGSELVLLSTSRRGTRICFSVLDRAPGHGIALECAPEPFSVARAGHAGIGLALAWREAHALSGRISLSRLQGGGTRAELELRGAASGRTPR